MNSSKILSWYDKNQREFPWRGTCNSIVSSYHVWLSEIMLQQTTTTAVIPYFLKFTQKWPKLTDLAKADLDEVLHAWAGLGYYSRARNLHQCAKVIMNEYDGCFPPNEQQLLKLPGIGPYTSAAIAAIAYDQPACPVDGNIARIFARVFLLEESMPTLTSSVREHMQKIVPNKRNSEFVQALMDIGATICLPKEPQCEVCPIKQTCLANQQKKHAEYPAKKNKPHKPTRYGYFFWIENSNGQVYLRKRPASGLLGGMTEIPSTPWQEDRITINQALEHAPLLFQSIELEDEIKHTFTHFHLRMKILKGSCKKSIKGLWVKPSDIDQHALPTLMKKVARRVLS